MEQKSEIRVRYLLRFYRQRRGGSIHTLYAHNVAHCNAHRREWGTTDNVKAAYEFYQASDAKRTAKLKAFEDLRDGPRRDVYDRNRGYSVMKRIQEEAYFWEVVKVTATIVTTYEEETVSSNAPAMLQIARAVGQ